MEQQEQNNTEQLDENNGEQMNENEEVERLHPTFRVATHRLKTCTCNANVTVLREAYAKMVCGTERQNEVLDILFKVITTETDLMDDMFNRINLSRKCTHDLKLTLGCAMRQHRREALCMTCMIKVKI